MDNLPYALYSLGISTKEAAQAFQQFGFIVRELLGPAPDQITDKPNQKSDLEIFAPKISYIENL